MKLTDENIDDLFQGCEVVVVRHNLITLGLTRDCLKTALDCLGEKSRVWDWQVVDRRCKSES